MSGEPRPPELTVEKYAQIAARVAVHKERPRGEVLAPYGLSEADWDATSAVWTKRLVDEIRTRSGSSAPIEERYPLSATYAKAYSLAVREVQLEAAGGEEEPTTRIAPGAPLEEPFSVLGASNRAAASARERLPDVARVKGKAT